MSWSSERDRGVLRWLCPDCARAHVREIEGKLPVGTGDPTPQLSGANPGCQRITISRSRQLRVELAEDAGRARA